MNTSDSPLFVDERQRSDVQLVHLLVVVAVATTMKPTSDLCVDEITEMKGPVVLGTLDPVILMAILPLSSMSPQGIERQVRHLSQRSSTFHSNRLLLYRDESSSY
jgi:hypothetical protein